ncbi:putative MORN repeat-containing protein [Neospora caninum Liverpool]|uniref:MORN repeat-containing protein, putative n=1 Tax=Neospora caninum (strain Liverpool) TaxID=572307 RepID=F0V7U8_NEOCL|nr:putative MORN repeat-containing protein [Neospora caninum Liverpool]CBZ49789.1 putative MORN repeat-containing protein [Neospora caninum Liverpool]CEL64377.1 TPA: MORN repeat-containing protein, putative [Neospora caninum Liverpool]|eukprot:XP_003879824.1 putative MORN repeat-containing protein [Neospora caninum Liverpool]
MGCTGSKAAVAKKPESLEEKENARQQVPKSQSGTLAGAAPVEATQDRRGEGKNAASRSTSRAGEATEVRTAASTEVKGPPAQGGQIDINEDPLAGIVLEPPEDCEPVMMKNGVVYRGEWKNGKQHGQGQQKQADGVVYIGQFYDGHIEGFGRLVRPDGSKYEGEFAQGKAHTKTRNGKYTFADGSVYVGQWIADKRHGIGREVTHDGSVYEGEYRNGCKHGHGRMQSPSGDVYEGEFSKGDMNGKGRYCWPDGRIYEGEWSMSRMHGKGVFFFVDGRKYEGEFKDSKMEGEGRLTWPDGSAYQGGFKGGLPHGRGTHQATAETKPRLALWNQGVRVKWLNDEEMQQEGEHGKQGSEGPSKPSPAQGDRSTKPQEQANEKEKVSGE